LLFMLGINALIKVCAAKYRSPKKILQDKQC